MKKVQTKDDKIKDSKKELILSTALKVFCKKGYEATTVDDIAKMVGISHGLFYHYYSSKKQILEEVMKSKKDFSIESLKEKLIREKSYVKKISLVAKTMLDDIKNDENCAYYFYFFVSEMFRIKEGKKALPPPPVEQKKEHPFDLLENIFIEGQKAGELIDKYSPKECAMLFISVIQGATLGYAISPKNIQKNMVLPKVEFIADIFAVRR